MTQLDTLRTLEAEVHRLRPPRELADDLLAEISAVRDVVLVFGRMDATALALLKHKITIALIPYEPQEG